MTVKFCLPGLNAGQAANSHFEYNTTHPKEKAKSARRRVIFWVETRSARQKAVFAPDFTQGLLAFFAGSGYNGITGQ
ncbi:MAG: hypothetical protein II697_06565 [Clostridia bacterium]|nr:hypothetical protein [Clostridia bacterium]